MKDICGVLFFILLSLIAYAEESTNFGWSPPNSSLNIGGYLDLTYNEHKDENFLFDDIALLFSADKERWSFLGEIELSHIPLDDEDFNKYEMRVNLERSQIDYRIDDTQHIAIGRFNSDIGYWNQAPIKFLQDTTTYPHIIEHMFPKSTTGIIYKKYLKDEDTLSITLQNNQDIGLQDDSIEIEKHISFSYHSVYDELSWRMAGGLYKENIANTESYYFGLGAEYESDSVTLQGEFFIQDRQENELLPYSGYLQSSWHFSQKQDAIFRIESYRDNLLDIEEQTLLIGSIYHISGHMAIKAEYLHHEKLPLNRFVYSFSVMF
jgi:hypothetical protein